MGIGIPTGDQFNIPQVFPVYSTIGTGTNKFSTNFQFSFTILEMHSFAMFPIAARDGSGKTTTHPNCFFYRGFLCWRSSWV